MENYIMFKGQKIELTEGQITQLEGAVMGESCEGRVSWVYTPETLAQICVGDTFKIGQYEFVVLEQLDGRTAIILKGLFKDSEEFGDCNNFKDSNVDNICGEFADEIESIIGAENLILHTVDLTSDDGLKCYGAVERKMSLITAEMYRRYVDILDKHKLDKWWWLATAYSTPKHDNDDWVKCVSPSGDVYYDRYRNFIGVRPFCILKSDIFVSR